MAGYRLDPAAFREELLNAPWMVELMRERAEAGKRFAEADAPDAPVIGEGYVAKFEVDSGTQGGIHHDRAWASLSNTDEAAAAIEFGHTAPNGTHVEGSYTLTHARDVMGDA